MIFIKEMCNYIMAILNKQYLKWILFNRKILIYLLYYILFSLKSYVYLKNTILINSIIFY